MGIFPPYDSYYTDLQNECFKSFLMSDGTTKDGQKMIAGYYQVQDLWKDIAKPDCDFERHWHVAIITCLLCTKLDYSSKNIQPGSLDIQDFKYPRAPHFKDLGVASKEQLKLIISGEFEAKMLKSTFNVQAYILKKLNGNTDELTQAMKMQSEWISMNKRIRQKNYFESHLIVVGRDTTTYHSQEENQC
jgi:hypothetical protein